MGDIAQRGNRLTFAKGGRAGYVVGGAVKGIGNILKKKFKKKKVYPETEELTHQKGPYVGDVGSEGKQTRKYAPIVTKALDAAKARAKKAEGGRAGHAHGMSAVKKAIKKISSPPGVFKPKDFKGKDSDKIRSLLKGKKTHGKDVPTMAAEGGIIGKPKWPSAPSKPRPNPLRPKGKLRFKKGKHPATKAEGGRIEFKKGRLAITKADLARSDLWRKRELKKRADKKREKKWDIKDVITSHPLNPFKVHAEGKAYDFTSKRKDVYVRTRDDLKKSQDPNVKGVAEGFQQMDYKDKAKGTQFEKDYEPKLTKPIHGRLSKKTGGKSDKKWIQKAVDPKHKGYCTPMTKKTCTPARKALARTFKKKAKTGW
jgi:hypothetical protein